MTILDELAQIAREQQRGHEPYTEIHRPLCRISKIPHEWCLGCRRGWHKHTYQPLPGAEPEPEVAEIVPAEVAPAEITPVDATPPEVEPPSVKIADIVVEMGSQMLGVPPERIDASALDVEIAGYEPVDLAAGPVEGIKKIWRDGELVYSELEQSLKDGVDEGRKP